MSARKWTVCQVCGEVTGEDRLTRGDIGGLIEAIRYRVGDTDITPGKVGRYHEIETKLIRALDTPGGLRELHPVDPSAHPDLDLDAIRERAKELSECESDVEAIRMVMDSPNLVGIVRCDSPEEREGEADGQLQAAVSGAVEKAAGPLGRARSRALDGVSDVDQMRDLNLVADAIGDLRAALATPTQPEQGDGGRYDLSDVLDALVDAGIVNDEAVEPNLSDLVCVINEWKFGQGIGENWNAAILTLRKAMCCRAGREQVERELIRPFGFVPAPTEQTYTVEQVRERLTSREALQAGADKLSGSEPADAAERNETRIEIEAAIAAAFQPDPSRQPDAATGASTSEADSGRDDDGPTPNWFPPTWKGEEADRG